MMARKWALIDSLKHPILVYWTLLRAILIIINTVSLNLELYRYLRLLALDGTMVLVGIPENDDRIGAANLINSRRSLAGSSIGGIAETQEMLNFCSKNEITSDIETIKIDYVNEAYNRVLKSDVRYRFVIDIFNSFKHKQVD